MQIRALAIVCILLLLSFRSYSQAPANDDIKNAIPFPSVQGYCSADAYYNNTDATPSGYKKGNYWNTEGKDIWFYFIASATDVSITVSGKGTGNATLLSPNVATYTYTANVLTEQIGSMTTAKNITIAYKGGLIIGEKYYVRISAENDAVGSFKLCINNYNPPRKPGQDYDSASLLCNKESFTELQIKGAGANNHEAAGTCLRTESNTAWYSWTAANDGSLTFSITPSSSMDDIDWVLFDLGPATTPLLPSASNAIRCASGSGINCIPSYFVTGINESSLDLTEQSNCISGQDGFVKSVDMISGHQYALLIDNFTSDNNGFTLSFGGTGQFVGPKTSVVMDIQNACTSSQVFTFSDQGSGYTKLHWNFGNGASIASADGTGPYAITYNTPGEKTVVLEATSSRGCTVISSKSFYVALKPQTPQININNNVFCFGDIIKLSSAEVQDAKYFWNGPNGFIATEREITLPVTSIAQVGTYRLTIKVGECTSDFGSVEVTTIAPAPVSMFNTDPALPGKFAAPVPIRFINASKYAQRYEWDFGDGFSSEDEHPLHTYTKAGKYQIKLRVLNENGCEDSHTLSDLVILDNSTLEIPNSFTPNGDGINDYFNVNLANLKTYSIDIFNRYGDKVFHSANIFDSWNGNYQNNAVPVGAYFYVINGTDLFGKVIRKSGSITLIR